MKTQLSKPARSKARYTEEYRQEALELWRASGRSAAKVAAELGIRAPLLYRWARPKRQVKLSAGDSKSGRSVEELEAKTPMRRTTVMRLFPICLPSVKETEGLASVSSYHINLESLGAKGIANVVKNSVAV